MSWECLVLAIFMVTASKLWVRAGAKYQKDRLGLYRINLMPHDVDLDNNDSYVITARQRVMGDDTTCIEEHALEGCNVTVSGERARA